MHKRPGKTFMLISIVGALCGIALFRLAILPAQAITDGATITVNSIADPSDPLGKCTLRDAIENANSDSGVHTTCDPGSGADTIIFSSSISTITLNSILPKITGILTLYGGQSAGKNQVVSGKDTYGIFSVASGAKLIVDRMTLTHGTALQGGAIAANLGIGGSTVVISDSILMRNQADYEGGAVSINSGTLTVTHSTFSNNQAINNTGNGGAINIAGGTAYIRGNSYFYENNSINGGAIYASNNILHLTDNTIFNINSASQDGGALYLNSVAMNMIDCHFWDSEAAYTGGAISAIGGIATISGSEFNANRLTGASFFGGAIYSGQKNRLNISDSTFYDNYAPAKGGAIASSAELTVTNTTFRENFVNNTDGWGGAIYLTEQGIIKAKARVESCTFFGNIAYRAGAIDNNAAFTQITNSTFYANSVEGYASAIYLSFGAITITQSTIAGNSGPSAIEMNTTNLTLRNSLISENLGANCSSEVINGGYNLQFGGTDPDSCGSGIEIGDPQLGPLADNGGPTWTMLFQSALAMNRIPGGGGCGVGVFDDQRGVSRPMGTGCDIGAVESNLFLYLPTIRK